MTGHYQVTVLGGGPAGLAAGAALRRAGLGVCVLERGDYSGFRVGEHLTPEGAHWLRTMGADELLQADRHLQCPGISSCWGHAQPSERSYMLSPYGDGWNLSRPQFDREFASWVRQQGVTVLEVDQARLLRRNGDQWEFEVRHDGKVERIRTSFWVDATGRAASIARRTGSRRQLVDKLIGITGIATPVNPEAHFGATILIEAMEDGWWYSAPLADNRLLATFMTDADLVARGKARWSRHWRERLACSDHTTRRLGTEASVDRVWVRPAQSQTLSSTFGEGWLAIGDAGAAFDPLSSQGISSSISGAALAGDAIRRYLTDYGMSALRDYGQMVETTFQQYLTERADYYRLEKRWPKSAFWRRRH